MLTAVMTSHAKRRCAEMGISTKIAKRIVQHADICYPGGAQHLVGMVAQWQGEPDYAVVFTVDPGTELPVVLTVLHRTLNQYQRDQKTA